MRDEIRFDVVAEFVEAGNRGDGSTLRSIGFAATPLPPVCDQLPLAATALSDAWLVRHGAFRVDVNALMVAGRSSLYGAPRLAPPLVVAGLQRQRGSTGAGVVGVRQPAGFAVGQNSGSFTV